MQPKTWYLGPLGDLRPLVSPDGGVSRTVTRYGGVHQALSSARTMDVTGHRASYQLDIPWLTPEESRFVEALHLRTVPGPFYLLDPMTPNRLSRSAACLLPYSGDVTVTSGGTYRSADAPDVGVPITSLEWSEFSAGATATLPAVPVLTSETVHASVWARCDQAVSLRVSVAFLGPGNRVVGEAADVVELGDTWQRCHVAAQVPAGAVAARLAVAPTRGDHVALAAAQLQAGELTAWDMGGGAPRVLVDQLERSSPNFPRNDVTLTLLEV